MARFFNTTGPCDRRRHYTLPPERRLGPAVDQMIERDQYFVIHAPRQSGKTTAALALAARLRTEGRLALYVTLETTPGTDVDSAEPAWLAAITGAASRELSLSDQPPSIGEFLTQPVGSRLNAHLAAWASRIAPRKIVLFLDEADVLRGPALVSLLRQLRGGFYARPNDFPASIGLIGMRDLRDYLAFAKDGVPIDAGSPFNVKAESLTLSNFTLEDIEELCGQHTEETGQRFSPDAVARSFWWTGGQPFLVNAIAAIAVDRIAVDRSVAIDAGTIDEAKERLVLSRTTHLDSLAQRLKEPRVAAIVRNVLIGDDPHAIDQTSDDFEYVLDLGLVRRGPEGVEPANPIYREVLARQLSFNDQESLPSPWWPWRRADGGLDVPALVAAFVAWWRENADMLLDRKDAPYREAAAHLAFMGFLQRVVNGGGKIHREYAAGRGRMDLIAEYAGERHVFEVKRVPPKHFTLERVEREGRAQLARYLDTLGLAEGWLIIFDQRPGRSWDERCFRRDADVDGKRLHIVGA
jgi:hypothetical protein